MEMHPSVGWMNVNAGRAANDDDGFLLVKPVAVKYDFIEMICLPKTSVLSFYGSSSNNNYNK